MVLFFLLSVCVTFLLVVLYCKLSSGSCRSKICLVGKTVIVTGSNTGIGYEAAIDFAKRGAKVILASRNEEKLKEAKRRIIEETQNENIIIKLVDMASFDSVRKFAQDIIDTEDRLDILVNNSGAGGIGGRTIDDYIVIMQVNYYSPFLLTHLVLPLMKKTGNGRIVNVSSIMAIFALNFHPKKIDLSARYTMNSSNYFCKKIDEIVGTALLYADSKLAQILFTQELGKKLKSSSITTYSLHPGVVKTGIFRYVRDGFMNFLIFIGKSTLFKGVEEGAQTTIFCALQRGIEEYSGDHFEDCARVKPYHTARSPLFAESLWEVTEKIVNLKPEEKI